MSTNTNSQPPAAGEAAHTPTPWRFIDDHMGDCEKPYRYGFQIRSGPGNFNIATVALRRPTVSGARLELDDSEGRANAALIIRAVNSHDALVEALGEYLKRDDEARREARTGGRVLRLLSSVFGGALPEKARAALAAAKG